jgi:Zn-dependent oligopeptidase
MNILDWNPSIESLQQQCVQIINLTNSNMKILEKTQLNSSKNREYFFSVLVDDIYEYSSFHSYCNFLKYVSPDKNIRQLIENINNQLNNQVQIMNQNKYIYDKVQELTNYDHICQTEEDKVFLNRILTSYRKNGVLLSPNDKKKLIKLKNNKVRLQDRLYTNVLNFDKLIGLSVDDIADLPINIVTHFPVVSENNQPKKFGMPLKRSTFTLAMKYLTNEDSRRKLEFIYNTWCLNNSSDFLKLVYVHNSIAHLLGYESYSHMNLINHTLENPKKVKTFLSDVLKNADRSFKREINILKKYKNNSDTINTWDLSYLISVWKKEYGFDNDVVREYFPLGTTLEKLFELFREYFNVKIIQSTDEILWDSSIKKYLFLYNDELYGVLYMDLFPRVGKFTGTGCFGIKSHGIYPYIKGKRVTPIVGLVMNLSCESPNYLLHHFELSSLLHELGHVFHYFFRKSKYYLLNGSSVEPDFIQVPSQIFYNLAWNSDCLKKISNHYQTSAILPHEIIEKIVKTRNIEIGITLKKQVFISVFEQLIHSSDEFISMIKPVVEKNNTDKLIDIMNDTFQQLFDQIISFKAMTPNQGIIFPNLWLNLIESPDEGIFSGLYSEIISSIIYNHCFGKHQTITAKQLFNKLYCADAWISGEKISINLLGKLPNITEYINIYDLNQDTEELSRFNDTCESGEDSSIKYSVSSDFDTTIQTDVNHYSEIDDEETINRERIKKLLRRDTAKSKKPEYIQENTETLKRYDTIFLKNN